MMSRTLAPIAVMAVTMACLGTPTSIMAAGANHTPSIFDIPAKTPEELKSIVDDLSHLRESLQKLKPGEKRKIHVPRSREEKEAHRKAKGERIAERRARTKELIRNHQPEPGMIHRMEDGDVERVYNQASEDDPQLDGENHRWLRELNNYYQNQPPDYMAPVDQYYDKWAQGYRLLGGFIDCDNDQDGSGSGDNNGGDQNGCSRWMMWAAYVNPNYSGGERDEYFKYGNNDNYYVFDDANNGDDDASSVTNLDCHSPNTEWLLMGVYREEFYQFLEQISKHLWAIDDYEYVTALAGLAYMTDADCYGVGYDDQGNYLYAGVMPLPGGSYQMGLYVDNACLLPDTSSGLTFDDFGMTNDMDLGSKDDGCIDDDTLQTLYGYWVNTQEYTLTTLNEVYSEYKYCTLCMDYPTYQDGYFIGDSGTDDDDMINQCWKFHSHDSYPCEADCISLGHAQGTILEIKYGSFYYGQQWDGSSGSGSNTVFDHYAKGYTNDSVSNVERLKANAFLVFNGILFIATFLAFSVARGSRRDSSEKSRSLLSPSDKKSRTRSKSKSKKRSSRSTSKRRSTRSTSKSKKSSRSTSRKRATPRS